jgi:hypothetical protein
LGAELLPYLFHLPIFPLGTISIPGLCVIWCLLNYSSGINKIKENIEKAGEVEGKKIKK